MPEKEANGEDGAKDGEGGVTARLKTPSSGARNECSISGETFCVSIVDMFVLSGV
jgi:hypothetical protein